MDKAEKTLGVSKGRLHNGKESWWWNDEIAKVVEAKSKAFKAWTKCESNGEEEKAQLRVVYDESRKNVKKMVAQARAIKNWKAKQLAKARMREKHLGTMLEFTGSRHSVGEMRGK